MENFEQEIIKQIKISLSEGIQKRLVSDYNSPLNKMVDNVVNKNQAELESIIEKNYLECIRSGEFKIALKNQFYHKLARLCVDKMDGSIEKRFNDFRSNPALKAKITMALENALNEAGK